MLLGSTGTWYQHFGAFQTAWDFTTHGQPIGKTRRKNCEGKATQDIGMIYINKSIPVPIPTGTQYHRNQGAYGLKGYA
jgi:hypothetical protein